MRTKMGTESLPEDNLLFSLELECRSSLQTAIVGEEQGDRVTIEGTIGALTRADSMGDTKPEIVGTESTPGVDLARDVPEAAPHSFAGGETK